MSLGAGFYTGARWAWMAGIIIYIVSIGLGIAEIVYGGNVGFIGGIIRTIAGIVIPVYLTRPGRKGSSARAQARPPNSLTLRTSVNAGIRLQSNRTL
ncbi:hypothetical protein E6H12_05075 [Candidatus Bathyarchaeota archaeon]|nr:MAG: hypothetical protein E6H12_05075 [Candidatus Bathyarchaeota archaeon]